MSAITDERLAELIVDYDTDTRMNPGDQLWPDVAAALRELQQLRRLDAEAAEYVESVICMRTHFTGQPPYVGWKGLGLALREYMDRMEGKSAASS